jgi:hypothetical protein
VYGAQRSQEGNEHRGLDQGDAAGQEVNAARFHVKSTSNPEKPIVQIKPAGITIPAFFVSVSTEFCVLLLTVINASFQFADYAVFKIISGVVSEKT